MTRPLVITPKRHVDERGWFSETFQEQQLHNLGITCRFTQENQSYSARAGTLRGMHFQTPPAEQAKLISVLRGKILDVVVDVRRASPTFGKYVTVELSANSGQQLFVPVGFAHGFLTLENEVTVMYKVSNFYAPAQDGGIRWDDPDVGVAWPIGGKQIVLSDKDKRLPLLKEFDSPFVYDGEPLTPLTISPPQ